MSKGNTFENELLLHIFNNSDIGNIGDATGLQGSTTPGVLWISLHSSDPGEAGDQSTNEIAYTNYTRISVVRSGAGWTVSGNQAVNASAITFPQCGATGENSTHFAVGTSETGTGKLLYSGTAPLTIAENITPEFGAGELVITED
jgi:hypothetical protein